MLESIVVRNKLRLLIFLFIATASTQVWSQDASTSAPAPSEGKSVSEANKKRISIKFDNELVEGTIQNPSMDYMFVRKEANYKKMMRLRENFLPEVKKGKRDFSGSR